VKRVFFLSTCLTAFVLLVLGVQADQNGIEEIFFKSNESYKQGAFEEAIQGYNQLIDGGLGNGHLFFNLGNAYFRMNKLGKALLNYERARLLLPRDADLNFNLAHAR